MKKIHGPDLMVKLQPLAKCVGCRGRGLVSGVFHQMACASCNGSGWVDAATGQSLPLEMMVTQLNMRLMLATQRIADLERPAPATGAAAQYEQNNRRGAGGTNYTGD